MFDGLALLLKYAFRAMGTVAPEVIGTFIGRLALLVSCLAVLWLDATPGSVLAGFLFGATIECVVLFSLLVRRLGWAVFVVPSPRMAWNTVVMAVPFLGFVAIQTFNQRLGVVVLSASEGQLGPTGAALTAEWALKEVGAFSAAYRFPEAISFIPVTLTGLLVPALVRLAGEEKSSTRMAGLTLRVMALVAVALALVFTMGRDVLAQLTGDGKFAGAGLVFGLLGCWVGVMVLQAATLNMLIAKGLYRAVLGRYIAAALGNLILSLSLIPTLGAAGAALGLLLADLAGLATDLWILCRRTHYVQGRDLRDLLLAILPAGALLFHAVTNPHPLSVWPITLALILAPWCVGWLIGAELPAIASRWATLRRRSGKARGTGG
jgi:O-antigen/teichoic acid export membrane protein